MSEERKLVGLVGAGTIGIEIVRTLVASGREVVVYDASETAMERAENEGARTAASLNDLVGEANVILLSLPGPKQVVEIVTGDNGLLAASGGSEVRDHIIVDTSTVDPETSRSMSLKAAEYSVGYLDAPILGRPESCGRWTLPVGGEEEYLEVARPVLENLASAVTHVGASGTGNVIKLLNNLMFGAISVVTAEVFAAARPLGIEPERFFEVVAGSEAATVSNLFRSLGPRMISHDFSPVFTVQLLRKDVDLAVKMIESAGNRSPLGNSVLDTTDEAMEAGYSAEDVSSLLKLFDNETSGSDGNGGL